MFHLYLHLTVNYYFKEPDLIGESYLVLSFLCYLQLLRSSAWQIANTNYSYTIESFDVRLPDVSPMTALFHIKVKQKRKRKRSDSVQ